jgi:hypothetical protein
VKADRKFWAGYGIVTLLVFALLGGLVVKSFYNDNARRLSEQAVPAVTAPTAAAKPGPSSTPDGVRRFTPSIPAERPMPPRADLFKAPGKTEGKPP